MRQMSNARPSASPLFADFFVARRLKDAVLLRSSLLELDENRRHWPHDASSDKLLDELEVVGPQTEVDFHLGEDFVFGVDRADEAVVLDG